MMSEHTTIIINWEGPFSYDEIAEMPEKRQGIYLVAGKRKHQKTESEIQYCGITEGSFYTRFKRHHKIWELNREQEFWLGNIVTPKDVSRYYLELAETLIIYFWQPTLNTRKKLTPPKPTTIINYWCKKDGSPRFNQKKIYKDLDDVLSWDGTFWRTGNLKVYEDS